VTISFNRKRDTRDLKKPTHFSKTVHLFIEVRCPGLTLDKGLTWKNQLEKKE
jgi:hypothetical protein